MPIRPGRCVWLGFAMVALGAAASSSGADDNWPRFRGPLGTGTVERADLPDRWSDTENVAWKTDIVGRGWSCPIVWGNRVFLTTVVNSGKSPEPKKGLYFGGEQLKPPETDHVWKVICLDLETGTTLWDKTVHEGRPATPVHIKNSYASETPVTDGERVYASFGNLGLFCLDLEGNPVWSTKVEPKRTQSGWGPAASPALHGDRLYLVNDNEEQSSLVALDKRTGEEIWRTPRDERSNWSTPFVWQHEQRTEIVTAGTKRMRAYDLEGKLLWQLGEGSAITIGTPYVHDNLLYLSSGYVMDIRRRPIFAVLPGATGDISLKPGTTTGEFIAWSQPMAAPYNPTTLVYKSRMYVLYDIGLLACFDARTGKEVYGKQRLHTARGFTASPWAYDNKVFCINEDGATFVIAAGDQFELLHSNKLADDDMVLATPAIAGDRLLTRTAARVYCLKK